MTQTPSGPAPRLPGGPSLPAVAQAVAFIAARRRTMAYLRRRYGSAYTMTVPTFGPTVVISDPALVKQLYLTSPEVAGKVEPNLGSVLGPGSFFAISGEAHRRQRKLLVPPFHGRRMQSYESIIEEETLREAASWPEGEEFETLEPMMRITLNAILRAVFGAEGDEQEALRVLLPPMVTLGSRLALLPIARHNVGPWSPWARFGAYRRQFDAIVGRLIDSARTDPALEERSDVLSIMLQSRYDDGEAMADRDVADQLLTLLAAGHETTATTLAWGLERLSRHPAVWSELVTEAAAGGHELREATILEIQRTRPVIDLTGRRVRSQALRLGEWTIPEGYTILVAIDQIHHDESVFPRADSFDPHRFVGTHPDLYAWVPFGGGTRRCIGAAFANMEMNVVLRTLVRDFELSSSYAPDEKWHSRGVAWAPARGGRAVLHRRTPAAVVAPADVARDSVPA